MLKSGQDLSGYRPKQIRLTQIHLPEDINAVLTIPPVIGTDFITITYFHPELLATDKKIFLFLYVFFAPLAHSLTDSLTHSLTETEWLTG